MMTKKHFKAIAEILKKNFYSFTDDILINDFCDYFNSENPLFDETKFREAIKN